MRFHAALGRALVEHGVDTLFGVMGDANLFMVDAYIKQGGRYVSTSNEAGAVLMANGFARTSGRVGFATVTHGPAVTNTVTALVESVKDRTPVVVIAGDTAVVDRENFQNVPQRDVVLPSGAGFEQVRSPHTAIYDLGTAIRRALLERRPVVLNVPIEFQWEDVEYHPVETRVVEPQAVAPDSAALDTAVGIIASANRPIVLAGAGATSPAARAALLRLAERIGAPVATSLRGKDLFRGEPFDLGICGTLASPVATEVLSQADCIVAFGAGLNKWTTAETSLLDKKQVVHVDIERANIGRFSTVHAAIVGDAATVADTIVGWLDEAEVLASGFRSEDLRARLAAYDQSDFADQSTDETVDLRTAMLQLDAAFPADRTLAFDGGRWIFNAFTMLHAPHPQAYVHTVNFGSIGLGMGNAIGASFGAPGRPVLLITGDGGFMLGGLAEFSTAVRHGVDLVVAVFNDSAYGAEHIQFRARDMDASASTFAWPDFAPVATALGGIGVTVRNRQDFQGLAEVIARRDRPVLIDIKIDPEKVSSGSH